MSGDAWLKRYTADDWRFELVVQAVADATYHVVMDAYGDAELADEASDEACRAVAFMLPRYQAKVGPWKERT